ncbi:MULTISPECIES: hypothetical protein [Sorangium]|uniref:Uncharacterized protein n=1 Tax=Sorangium cellulosum TaxID=56 RepID=A0A4P2QYW5_SORCE|nr:MULTISPECIES: hypothetical protein [Sorangium]AUX34763.1 hypothetical protein SOCE836_069390 [Sorangium cellulosum]WCQ94074.1 hypothetical protein NQZ70_06831 [Sorangium sp. Soce836]
MARYGYSFVPDRGFSAFSRDLGEGAWKDVSIKKYDTPDRMPPQLMEAPRPVAWKLRATWSIAALDEVLGIASASELAALDAEWDAAQRALHHFVASAEEGEDAAVREAATRVRAVMLKGNGTEQTRLGYDAEVDFGRSQAAAAKRTMEADLKKIGAGAHLKRIERATEALARGIGRGGGEKRLGTRAKRLRAAISGCVTAFNAIHDEITWLLAHTAPGVQRQQLEALHAPFLALLERYPPPARSGTRDNGEGEEELAMEEPADDEEEPASAPP